MNSCESEKGVFALWESERGILGLRVRECSYGPSGVQQLRGHEELPGADGFEESIDS